MSIIALIANKSQSIQNLFSLNMCDMSFGELLKQKRMALGITQRQLADAITSKGHYTTVGSISNIERGYYKKKDGSGSQPAKSLVLLAAQVLGCDEDEFLVAADYSPSQSNEIENFDGIGQFAFQKGLAPADLERYKLVVKTALESAKAMIEAENK